MPTYAPKPSANRVIAPKGTHIARCVEFIHIGTVTDNYMGQPKVFNKIRLTFELPEKLHVFKAGDAPKPIIHSQEYTLSMGKKSNLRPIVEGMIGTSLTDDEAYGFNHEELVNMPCLISIAHKKKADGTDRAEITSTSTLMDGQTAKFAYNPLRVLTYEKWNQEHFDSLPDFLKDKMKGSEEYKKLKGLPMADAAEITADEIPF